MDNNTTYIDDFITTRNRVKEWTQYFNEFFWSTDKKLAGNHLFGILTF